MTVVTKCQLGSPIRHYGAGTSTAVKRVTEYQQAYKAWPWQPVRRGYKPEPPKKTNDRQQSMQKKTSYAVDYASRPIQRQGRVKKPKGSLNMSMTPQGTITTYNADLYTKLTSLSQQYPEHLWNTEALVAVKALPPDTEPLSFEGEPIYIQPCPSYQPRTINVTKPAIITTKDNLHNPAAGDTMVTCNQKTVTCIQKTVVKEDFVPSEDRASPEFVSPTPAREPITKSTKYKEHCIDPLQNLNRAKIQMGVEINPEYEVISTAMADFTAPSKPQRRNPKIPADNIQRNIAPLTNDTTFKMTYKEWPVMPPEHPTWAKKPVYKRRSGGFVTKSLYVKDFCNPHVVDRDMHLRPVKRDVNIITNKPDTRPFNYVTTYDNDYKLTEGAKAPATFCVKEKYKLPSKPMATETIQMSDYKVHQLGLTLPIRHSSQHRELYDNKDMTFDTTYNKSFCVKRPKSCPAQI